MVSLKEENIRLRFEYVPGDGMKLNPEKENFAMWPYSGQLALLIRIRVAFNSFTRYKVTQMFNALHLVFIKDSCLRSTTPYPNK